MEHIKSIANLNFQRCHLRKVNNVLLVSIFLLLFQVTPLCCEDVVAQSEKYEPDYSIYHNVSRLIKEIRGLESRFKSYMTVSDKFSSRNGVTQLFTRLSNFSFYDELNSSRIKILFAFGEHAREFFPVESLLYFLKNVTQGTKYFNQQSGRKSHSYSFSSWVLSNFDFYIVALTNPDGRHFIENTRNYCWRGTSNGIDLNRNFDWSYGKEGSSGDPHDEEYRGAHAFSEPETQIFQNVTHNISFDAFVSFHSGVREIYIPFADSLSKLSHRVPINKAKMVELAHILASSTPLRLFKYGPAHDLTGYFADGTSFDYMSGVNKIPFSFAIELWQHKHHTGLSCFDEFNPHSNNLEIELALVHPLYVEFLTYLYNWKVLERKKRHMNILDQRQLTDLKKDENDNKKSRDSSKEIYQEEEESSLQGQMMFLIVFLIVIFLAYVGIKHIMHIIHKKRVISLRSLSSTFAMFRS